MGVTQSHTAGGVYATAYSPGVKWAPASTFSFPPPYANATVGNGTGVSGAGSAPPYLTGSPSLVQQSNVTNTAYAEWASSSAFASCFTVDGYESKTCSCKADASSFFAREGTKTATVPLTITAPIPGTIPGTTTMLGAAYTPPAACCNECRVIVNTVRLYYWPPDDLVTSQGTSSNGTSSGISGHATASNGQGIQAPINNATTNAKLAPRVTAPYTLISDGFTYTSPSVYVVYSNIRAAASCIPTESGVFGTASQRAVGGEHNMVTKAYAPEDISTWGCPYYTVSWKPLDYSVLYDPPAPSKLLGNASTCFEVKSGVTLGTTQLESMIGDVLAHPRLSLHADLSLVDPAWSTCTPLLYGGFDPPRPMVKASGLDVVAATPTDPSIPVAPSAAPSPGVFITSPGADPTAAPVTAGPALTGPMFHTTVAGNAPTDTSNLESAMAHSTIVNDPGTNSPAVPLPAVTGPAANTPPANNPATNSPAVIDPAVNNPVANSPNSFLPVFTGFPAPAQNPAPASNPPAATPNPIPAQGPAAGPNPLPAPAAGNSVPAQNPAPAQIPPAGQSPAQVPPASNGPVQNPSPQNFPPQGAPIPGAPDQDPPVPGNPAQGAPAQNPAPPGASAPATSPPGSPAQVAPNQGVPASNIPPQGAPASGNPAQAAPAQGVSAPGIPAPGISAQAPTVPGSPAGVPSFSNAAVPAGSQAGGNAVSPGFNAPPVIGGQSVQQAPGGGAIVGGSTLSVGATTIIGNTPVTVASDHIIAAGSAVVLVPTANTAAATGIGAGTGSSPGAAQINSNGALVMAGATISQGSQQTISGHVVSVDSSSHIIVDSSTFAAPVAAPSSGLPAVNGQSIQTAAGGGIVVGSSTITPGSQATVAGHVISAGSSNIIVDANTFSIPPALPTNLPAVNGQSIQTAPNGGVVVAGSTIAPGSQATVSGHVISAGPSNVIVDATTFALPTASPIPDVLQSGIQSANGPFNGVVTLTNGAVISAGGSAATVSGKVVSVLPDNNGILVGGSTVALPSNLLPTSITVAGQTLTAASIGGGFVIGTTTLSAGGSAMTISGTPISVLPNKAGLVVGSSTVALPAAAPSAQFVYTVGGQIFTAAPTGFAIGSSSLSVGGSAVTISGTVVSLGSSGLQIGSSTIALPTPIQSVYTVGGQTFTAAPTGFSIAGTSLSAGGSAITISGTLISLGPSGLQIGTSTIPLTSTSSLQSIITVAGQTFTAAPTGFSIAGTSLSPDGSAITISGTIISLGSAGLQIGSSTLPLTASASTTNLGALITSGLAGATPSGSAGAGTGAATKATSTVAQGAGARIAVRWGWWVVAVGVVWGVGAWL